MSPSLQAKYSEMQASLRQMQRVVVAFSAGVDSTVVLKAALDTLGRENVLAATGVSPSLAQAELESVRDLAARLQAPLELVKTEEMDNPQYAANSPNRCFFCKSELYAKLTDLARARGFSAILSGVNFDDSGDWRPGISAGDKFHVRAPLLEARLTKADVRELARELGLPNWQKPALACLSSRIPYGMPVTIQSLAQVEQAEAFLRQRGFSVCRVRHHGNLARVEVPVEDLPKLLAEPLRAELVARFKSLGYTYVTADVQGFRSGSGTEVLAQATR